MKTMYEKVISSSPANKRWTPSQVVNEIKNCFTNYNIECDYSELDDLGIWVSVDEGDYSNNLRDRICHRIFNLMRHNHDYSFLRLENIRDKSKDYPAYACVLFRKNKPITNQERGISVKESIGTRKWLLGNNEKSDYRCLKENFNILVEDERMDEVPTWMGTKDEFSISDDLIDEDKIFNDEYERPDPDQIINDTIEDHRDTYRFIGGYYPATYWEPAESPELVSPYESEIKEEAIEKYIDKFCSLNDIDKTKLTEKDKEILTSEAKEDMTFPDDSDLFEIFINFAIEDESQGFEEGYNSKENVAYNQNNNEILTETEVENSTLNIFPISFI